MLVIVELLALFVANQLSGVLFGGVAALEETATGSGVLHLRPNRR